MLWGNFDCYDLGTCYSRSLPRVDTFVGREEDIRNITGYLDFTSSDVEVVHIVGPPGFGKSTLAKKIGHILLRKGVKVHYADIRQITNWDAIAEKIMLSIVDSTKHKLTFDHLERWVHKQYSNTLLILDNCDEVFETHKENLLDGIRALALSSYKKRVRYILTSQKWEADVGNFQLHAIYNLSSEAASQLLSKLAPSLTDVQKMQIAELTGNVPLALDVVGAIFKFPNAPTAEEVIQSLRENPVTTLSSSKIHSKLDVSIGLAYSYLSPELKQLCLNLSQFPGSFSGESAFAIFDISSKFQMTGSGMNRLIDRESPLDMLVQRSLLQFNSAQKRFYFHQLIQKYFLHVTSQEEEGSKLLKLNFESKFQLYFAQTLDKILKDYLLGHLAVTVLNDEKHNFGYMFSLFKTAKHVNNAYFGVQVTLRAIHMNILEPLFFPTELRNISWIMLTALESYTAAHAEVASVESFLETYVSVVVQTARLERQFHMNADFAIEILSLRRGKVDEGYEMNLLSNYTYTMFYRVLGQYYKENGQQENATLCDAHILARAHDQLDHCYPHSHCDYFSISVAYENIGDSANAFQFRKRAHKHQWSSLSPMQQVKLTIDLYNDYSNVSLGNSVSQADQFSSLIINQSMSEYLMIASGSDYLEDVYYDAVDFFKSKNMDEHVIRLQYKMNDIIRSQCELEINGNVYVFLECTQRFISVVQHAWKRQCYYLTILSGIKVLSLLSSYKPETVLMKVKFSTYMLVAESYYQIGNYSAAQIWLKQTLHIVNEGLKEYSFMNRTDRKRVCFYLLMSGDYFNAFCYGYIIKDTIIVFFAHLIDLVYEEYVISSPKKQPEAEAVILSTETGVTEEKYSFVWSQFNHYAHKFQCAIDKHVSRVYLYSAFIVLYFLLVITACKFSTRIAFVIIYLMSFFCTRQQILCCFSCVRLIIVMVAASIITMFVFVLGLDWLY